MARNFTRVSSEYLENASAVVSAWPVSFAAWFKSDSATTEQVILCIANSSVTNNFVSLSLRGDEYGDYIWAWSKQGNDAAISTAGYPTGQWHHAAAVFASASSRTIYLDGRNSNTNTNTSSDTGFDATAVGRHCDATPGDYFSGDIAEAAIYDVALTANDAAQLAAGFSPALVRTNGLVAYWPLIRDEDQDRVGGYDLTAYNTPAIAAHVSIRYPSMRQLFWGTANQEYEQAVAGVLTMSGTIAKLAQVARAGALTPSGALTRLTQVTREGVITPSGTTAKLPQVSQAGTITPGGTTTKQVRIGKAGTLVTSGALSAVRILLQSVAGAISFVGSLAKQGQKAISGALTPSGILSKSTAVNVAGTITPSGTLTAIRILLQSIAGTLGLSGALSKTVEISPGGAITPSGDVAKRAQRELSGNITPSGILSAVRMFFKSLAGTLGLSGAVTKLTSTDKGGIITPSGEVAKQAQVSASGGIAPSGTLGAIRLFFLALAGAFTSSGELVRQAQISPSGSITPAGTVAKMVQKALGGALAFIGALTASIVSSVPTRRNYTPSTRSNNSTATGARNYTPNDTGRNSDA